MSRWCCGTSQNSQDKMFIFIISVVSEEDNVQKMEHAKGTGVSHNGQWETSDHFTVSGWIVVVQTLR